MTVDLLICLFYFVLFYFIFIYLFYFYFFWSLELSPWWRHQMETFSALLAICAGNLPVTGEFPAQRPATQSFDVFFDACLNKRLGKHWWGWWFQTPSRQLWRHCNALMQLSRYQCINREECVNHTSSLWTVIAHKTVSISDMHTCKNSQLKYTFQVMLINKQHVLLCYIPAIAVLNLYR